MRGKNNAVTKHDVRAAGIRVAGYCAMIAAISIAASGFQAPTPNAAAANPAKEMVTKYCVTCHNQRLKTANLVLDSLDFDHPANSAESFEKVIVKLRSRTMPPTGVPRPDKATYDTVSGYLETELDRASAAKVNPGRLASLHRLNRTEYANAIRDLLGVEVDETAVLPPDEQAYGFDTNAEALAIQPALLDRYVNAAAKISRLAIGDPTMPPGFDRYSALKGNTSDGSYLWQTDRLSEEFPLGSRGGVFARHYFPVDGEYILKIRLQRTYAGIIRGLNAVNQFEIRLDGKRVGQFSLGGSSAAPPPVAGQPPLDMQRDADEILQVRVPVKAGLREVSGTMLKANASAAEGLGPNQLPLWSREGDIPTVPAAITALLIGGPYSGKVSNDSPSRRLIFVCQPTSRDEDACATKILTTLAQRAYRRAATEEDVQTLTGFYKRGRTNGSFDEGIRVALERVLVSPDFLFRIEADPASAKAGESYRISDTELASRLSFALWSSIPDDELLNAAISGKLREPAVLEQQVNRMMADPRARKSLVQNFFEEWLQVRNVWLLKPENTKFPWFEDNLRIAFVKEIQLFLDMQLKENRSVVDLLTSNETFLNDRLARHYGIPGVYGSHFRRVELTDENRFGLLGKGSVLAITSYPTRTSPTVRGKWLLENILAAPMPAPPPNVPALEASNTEGKPKSVREMLEMHRKNAVCASCHARMDPLGLSLENFDAVGQWRTTDAGTPINASGVLLDGTKVSGPAELQKAFVAQKTQFVKAVTEKLLTYSLGRGLEYYDAPAVRGIVRGAAANDYQWSSLILEIVKSAPFQMRRAGS